MTSTIEQSVEIAVPVRSAYNQWTQFETFPQIMDSVKSVEQRDDTHLRWKVAIGRRTEEFETEICEQIPDKLIAWKTFSGPYHAGVVTFHRLDALRCKVMVQLDYEPEGLVESVGDKLGVTRRRVESSLEAFREFLEERGQETGAWRGSVPNPDERAAPPPPPAAESYRSRGGGSKA